jgi:Domain of unknown function (DUF4407)
VSSLLVQKDRRAPILWWIAGADADVLAECPRGDQIFVQHLGLSLIVAFLFVLVITSVSILVAFPDLSTNLVGMLLAPAFALLIASTVFLIDRLFIQSDWDWQAGSQKRELARAAWEKATLEQKLLEKALNSDWRISQFLKRCFLIAFRVLLSAAIGLTIASFLELVIYKDEIKSLIQRLHYEENKNVYDEINARTALLDEEIQKVRSERNRLLGLKASTETELNRLELQQPPVPSDKAASDLDAQLNELRAKIDREETKVRQYNEDMVAELRGTLINPWNSGMVGLGPKYQTASDLKALSESAIARYRKDVDVLETQRQAAVANRGAEIEDATKKLNEQKNGLRAYLAEVAGILSQAQQRLTELETKRDPAILEFANGLKAKPSFIPISFGVASQFRALRTLYAEYGSTFEMYMIKLLIMLLEMTPVLQKWLMSPTTLYAARLDATKRFGAYESFEEELRRRQEHLRNKAFAERDEQLDRENIEMLRRSNVTPLHERQGSE